MAVADRPIITVTDDNCADICTHLMVGDLIFRHGTKKGLDAIPIRNFQSRYGGYGPVASNITHVALYSGDGKVIHAVPPQAKEDVFLHYFIGANISICTWEAPGIDRSTAVPRMITLARSYIGKPYSSFELFKVSLAAMDYDRHQMPNQPHKKRLLTICSTMVFDLFDAVLGAANPLDSEDEPRKLIFYVPAELFIQRGLGDIPFRPVG